MPEDNESLNQAIKMLSDYLITICRDNITITVEYVDLLFDHDVDMGMRVFLEQEQLVRSPLFM